MSSDATSEQVIDKTAYEDARSDREGYEWLRDHASEIDALDAAESGTEASAQISQRAFDMIVEFEVTGRTLYEQRYRKPIWPRGASGVTIGIGYDVGYVGRERLRSDWGSVIPEPMLRDLEHALGVTGEPAKAIADALETSVDVPWDAATSVHRGKVMPRWTTLVGRALPNTQRIGADCLGALVSLAYNRGASFGKDGERYQEMRNIRRHMENEDFQQIPQEFRSMKRLWPTVPGLQKRREREAKLFEDGLATS